VLSGHAMCVMPAPQTKRWYDFKNPGSQGDGSFLGFTDEFKGTENGYPGGELGTAAAARGEDQVAGGVA
jgi:hypothetical protein